MEILNRHESLLSITNQSGVGGSYVSNIHSSMVAGETCFGTFSMLGFIKAGQD